MNNIETEFFEKLLKQLDKVQIFIGDETKNFPSSMNIRKIREDLYNVRCNLHDLTYPDN